MAAKKEADVKAHFEEAAASYKRLLTGSVMASSSDSKRSRTVAAAPVPPAAVQTTIKAHEPAPVANPTPAAVETTLPPCRTYMEANALLNRCAHALKVASGH